MLNYGRERENEEKVSYSTWPWPKGLPVQFSVNQLQSINFSLVSFSQLDSVRHCHSVQRTTAWLLVIQIQSISISQSFWVSQFQFLYHGRTHVICHIMSYDMSLYHVVSWYNSCQIYYFLSWYILASNVMAWPII